MYSRRSFFKGIKTLLIWITLWFILLFIFSQLIFAFEMNELPIIPGSDYSGYSNYLEDTPPQIENITIIPKEPAPEDEVVIKAAIFNNPDKTDAEVTEATLFYSTDEGKTYKEIIMEQDEADARIWFAKIPPQQKGTKVMFYITAIDSENNYAVEVPQKSFDKEKEVPPDEEFILTSIDKNEDVDIVKDDMDILTTFIAHDEKYLYFKLQLQENITDGTLEPPFLHNYLVNIINLEQGLNILGSYLLGYMPYMRLVAYPECYFYDTSKISFIYDAGNSCKVNKNMLYLKVEKKTLGKSMKEGIKIVHSSCASTTSQLIRPAGTGTFVTTETTGLIEFLENKIREFIGKPNIILEDIDDIRKVIAFQDLTPYSIIYLRSHSYEVK